MSPLHDMRKTDIIPRESVTHSIERFHHGPLGRVLERHLKRCHLQAGSSYSMVALKKLWSLAASNDPAIGLHLFSHFSRQDWSVLLHAALYSADLAGAVRFWASYAQLASDMDEVVLVEEGDFLGVEIRIDAPACLARHMVEHYCVMSLSVLREATGTSLLPQRACFAHRRPTYHSEYNEWFGDDVRFDCGCNCMCFDRASLSLPLKTRHQGMWDVSCQELDRRLTRQHQLSGWSGRVAKGVRRGLDAGQLITLDQLAQELHQSPRTLRRRLEQEGMTFRCILDRARAELEQYLQMQGIGRAQIAAELGYNDLSAYVNARKRWCKDCTGGQ
ncbi:MULTISPECIES: AraC family transcriptional regulator ligand-binding domain-containing protein [Stenotrophomonas]|nr:MULTISPECIES: AraC family transcriptional regulator ligand-binding domain-containing protein [Stenotrophomonas]HDS1148644.1 AraC family transcriptional regulator ligand-binding domain-containing protein [Stenotrophomonas maltophilia]HDS1162195.1 AraC family transcriptional regulator ligand-binding domain-containing protein [Stenotrophomonas maltophilia]HEL5401651.1 AraC family transcriptional regulator ligand-binding domain-containing protein [Stenotrophomonas maltophilia]